MAKEKKSFRVSSNATLLLKIGLPVFWIIFFGAIALGLIFSGSDNISLSHLRNFKLGVLLFFLFFVFLLYNTLLKLKRVELADDGIYVSNYFKTYRYQYEDVEKIKSIDFGILLILSIRLKHKGKMGRKLPFIASKSRLNEYLINHAQSEFTLALDKQKDK